MYYYDPFGSSGVNEESQRAFLRAEQARKEKKEIRKISASMGIAIVMYIVLQLTVVGALSAFDLMELYNNNAVFQNAFTILGVSFLCVAVPFGIMALVNRKKYEYPVIPNEPVRAGTCFLWVSFGMVCCIGANVVVTSIISALENALGVTFTQGELLEPDSVLACLMTCISTAIIPAICEEFAMRCCSLQLLRKYGKGFAVFAVSIVFGLLHGNVIQFIFAFLIGLVLGLVTIKTGSIVPAVLIHALNNGVSVVNSILTYTSGEDMAQSAIVVIYGFWIVAGVVSLIRLLSKGAFKIQKKDDSSALSTGQKFSAFLFPFMIVPFVILIIMTATTIIKA